MGYVRDRLARGPNICSLALEGRNTMTTIPLKDDGAPDWKTSLLQDKYIFAQKQAYIAGLERCAEWHEEQAGVARQHEKITDSRYFEAVFRVTAEAHERSAAAIHCWIEKEKANG